MLQLCYCCETVSSEMVKLKVNGSRKAVHTSQDGLGSLMDRTGKCSLPKKQKVPKPKNFLVIGSFMSMLDDVNEVLELFDFPEKYKSGPHYIRNVKDRINDYCTIFENSTEEELIQYSFQRGKKKFTGAPPNIGIKLERRMYAVVINFCLLKNRAVTDLYIDTAFAFVWSTASAADRLTVGKKFKGSEYRNKHCCQRFCDRFRISQNRMFILDDVDSEPAYPLSATAITRKFPVNGFTRDGTVVENVDQFEYDTKWNKFGVEDENNYILMSKFVSLHNSSVLLVQDIVTLFEREGRDGLESAVDRCDVDRILADMTPLPEEAYQNIFLEPGFEDVGDESAALDIDDTDISAEEQRGEVEDLSNAEVKMTLQHVLDDHNDFEFMSIFESLPHSSAEAQVFYGDHLLRPVSPVNLSGGEEVILYYK